MAGSIVVNVDYSFDEIEIPGCATCFSRDINFQNIKKLILNRPSQKLLKDIKTFAPDQIKVCGLEKDSMKNLSIRAHSSPPDYVTRNIVTSSDGVFCALIDKRLWMVHILQVWCKQY